MTCPACGHPHGSEAVRRRGWFFGPLLVRCGHVTDVQDALVDDVTVCRCAARWHLAG